MDANEDLVFAQLGIGHIFVLENFRSTEFMNANGFHGLLPYDSNHFRTDECSTQEYCG